MKPNICLFLSSLPSSASINRADQTTQQQVRISEKKLTNEKENKFSGTYPHQVSMNLINQVIVTPINQASVSIKLEKKEKLTDIEHSTMEKKVWTKSKGIENPTQSIGPTRSTTRTESTRFNELIELKDSTKLHETTMSKNSIGRKKK
jgi:hypothetical protein